MRTILVTLVVLAYSAVTAPADEVEHPAYASWARQPIGTSVIVRSVTASPAGKLTTTTTYTLLERNPDGAVLEIRRVSDATGTRVESLPEKYRQLRMFPLLPGVKKEQIGRPTNALAQGEETLTVAGRKLKALWYDTKDRGESGEILTRTWLSNDVPNRLVKAVTRIPKASTTVTVELVDFKTP